MSMTVCLYFPKKPETLFKFLDSVMGYEAWTVQKGAPDKVELLLWVDNDDHGVSSEFYTLRKYARKLNLQVFVNPALGSSDAVFEELRSKASGDEVLVNNGYEHHLGLLMGGSSVFDEEEGIREVKREKA